MYPWQEAEKSLSYNQVLFKFLSIRQICGNMAFDVIFFILYGPAYLWSYYLGRFNEWGWCSNGDGNFNMQLLCGLFCAVTYKVAEIVWMSPWLAYQMWGIEKKYGLAEPTVISFIWMRFA